MSTKLTKPFIDYKNWHTCRTCGYLEEATMIKTERLRRWENNFKSNIYTDFDFRCMHPCRNIDKKNDLDTQYKCWEPTNVN